MELSCHITQPTQNEWTLLFGKIKKALSVANLFPPEQIARNVYHQYEYELYMLILFKNLMF